MSLALAAAFTAAIAAAAAAAAPAPPGKAAPRAAPSPAAAGAPAPARLEIPALVERMQKQYDRTQDLKARFSQEYTQAATGRKKVKTGQVQIKKPGRVRMDYEAPEKELYLSTGQVFWMYQPEDKQALRQDPKAAQLPEAFSFLIGKGKLSEEFDISVAKELPYGTASDYRLSLKPKQPQSTYKNIYFVVDPTTFLVRQTILVTATGDVNAISFSDLKLNTKIPDTAFKWTPPPGTKVIDAGKLGK
jgi:outer membrane lipoprotein carrier protein